MEAAKLSGLHLNAARCICTHLTEQLWSLFSVQSVQRLRQLRVQRAGRVLLSRFLIFGLENKTKNHFVQRDDVLSEVSCSSLFHILPYLTLDLRNSFGKLGFVGLWEVGVNTDGLALLPTLLVLVLETTGQIQKDILSLFLWPELQVTPCYQTTCSERRGQNPTVGFFRNDHRAETARKGWRTIKKNKNALMHQYYNPVI